MLGRFHGDVMHCTEKYVIIFDECCSLSRFMHNTTQHSTGPEAEQQINTQTVLLLDDERHF